MDEPHLDDPDRWAMLGVHWHGSAEIRPETSSDPAEEPAGDLPEIEPRCLRSPDEAIDWVDELTRTYAHRYEVRIPYADPPHNIGTVADEAHLERDRAADAQVFQRGDSLRRDFVLAHTEPEPGFPRQSKYRVHLRVEAVLGPCQQTRHEAEEARQRKPQSG